MFMARLMTDGKLAAHTRVREYAGLGICGVWSQRLWTKMTDFNGRGGGIRTPDPLLPKQMRYQATLRPDSTIVSHQAGHAWWPSHSRNQRMRKIGARKTTVRVAAMTIRNTQSRQVCRRDW